MKKTLSPSPVPEIVLTPSGKLWSYWSDENWLSRPIRWLGFKRSAASPPTRQCLSPNFRVQLSEFKSKVTFQFNPRASSGANRPHFYLLRHLYLIFRFFSCMERIGFIWCSLGTYFGRCSKVKNGNFSLDLGLNITSGNELGFLDQIVSPVNQVNSNNQPVSCLLAVFGKFS